MTYVILLGNIASRWVFKNMVGHHIYAMITMLALICLCVHIFINYICVNQYILVDGVKISCFNNIYHWL